MKKTRTIPSICRFLPAALLLISANSIAQDGYSYTASNNKLSKNRNNYQMGTQDTNGKQSLITVLKDLNKQKGVYFLYSEESMSERLVNKVKNMQGDIERILDEVLKNTGLKYRKVSDTTFVTE